MVRLAQLHVPAWCFSFTSSLSLLILINSIVTKLMLYPFPVGARFMFKGVEVPEHSLVVRETIGLANDDTLMCVTDYSPCCADPENAWFRDFETGAIVSTRTNAGVYQTRDTGVVRLHYNDGNPDGIFYCRIRVSATELQTLYVGVYPSVDDHPNGVGANGDGKSVWNPSEIHHNVVCNLWITLMNSSSEWVGRGVV